VFALDANALIYALKGRGRVRQTIEGTRPSDLAVPAVVAYELEVGTLRSRDPELRRLELNRLLSVLFFRSTDGQPRVQRACGSIWKKQGQVSGHGIL
jgi:predicted nucleic acid-binding protein